MVMGKGEEGVDRRQFTAPKESASQNLSFMGQDTMFSCTITIFQFARFQTSKSYNISWGAGAPLNSNYLLAISYECSVVQKVGDTAMLMA